MLFSLGSALSLSRHHSMVPAFTVWPVFTVWLAPHLVPKNGLASRVTFPFFRLKYIRVNNIANDNNYYLIIF